MTKQRDKLKFFFLKIFRVVRFQMMILYIVTQNYFIKLIQTLNDEINFNVII